MPRQKPPFFYFCHSQAFHFIFSDALVSPPRVAGRYMEHFLVCLKIMSWQIFFINIKKCNCQKRTLKEPPDVTKAHENKLSSLKNPLMLRSAANRMQGQLENFNTSSLRPHWMKALLKLMLRKVQKSFSSGSFQRIILNLWLIYVILKGLDEYT